MSKHQRSSMPWSRAARLRASSTASQYASAGMPRVIDEYGLSVTSAYRTDWAARPAPMS